MQERKSEIVLLTVIVIPKTCSPHEKRRLLFMYVKRRVRIVFTTQERANKLLDMMKCIKIKETGFKTTLRVSGKKSRGKLELYALQRWELESGDDKVISVAPFSPAREPPFSTAMASGINVPAIVGHKTSEILFLGSCDACYWYGKILEEYWKFRTEVKANIVSEIPKSTFCLSIQCIGGASAMFPSRQMVPALRIKLLSL
ncbi:uncharacterized protein BDR25DRAFT_360719 [Lindgomyces ingoldianus]|uniref:Uncharacterized protein n=1 Tax=Lindgomyces ingoldianus TaxID=673940 RepID=A0ACB6QES4_9PLEO|nr:uncharacterized protein BDR25DRAFT_360719 [Lindgomyces ingoldianus]KAF2465360.1 hypothetical protein BDR25DRAFT_360719 [Lindgomyces ingoldianus]